MTTPVRQTPSAICSPEWNDLEHVVAHAIGLVCIRHGVRTTAIAAALSAYRARILARLEFVRGDSTGEALEAALEDIRQGRLA